ncbi:MAG TPA: dihydroneopterin aldolase, partial [Candidatus Thermoplasmatota archaeon]|nr:dihydroneopterin aldolase [Candidatus Thermoplasmatota archaeon]
TQYRSLRVELTTHAAGGLTRNDFVLAAKIDRVLASVHDAPPAPPPAAGTPRKGVVPLARAPEAASADRILVRDLEVECIIGTQPKERDRPQRVCINLEVHCDTRAAASSDDIRQTLDYKRLKDRLLQEVGRSRHELLETLAQHVASLVLEDAAAQAVDVTVDKPGALTGARSVAVRIRRVRPATAGDRGHALPADVRA